MTRVLGEVKKDTFTALPGEGNHSRLNALKYMCPYMGNVVTSFTVIVQRGCGKLMDFLLMGWW